MLDSRIRFAIPLHEPFICGNEWKYIKDCLDTGWVSSAGAFVDLFERRICEYTNSRCAVATVNGTSALHIALLVAGIQPDDEVIVPTLTFIAPVNAIAYCLAHPVFMDCDRDTWQIDVEKLASFLEAETRMEEDGVCRNKKTGRTIRAILPVHILGSAVAIDTVVDLASRYNLKIVEDAAEGLGVRYKGKHIGTFGDIGILSFNGNKIITTGGGGMILTDQELLARRARYLVTQAKDEPNEYVHNEVGFNYRLTNLQAAMGVAQLEQLGEFIQKKKANSQLYREGLCCVPGVAGMKYPEHVEPNYWLTTLLIAENSFGCSSRSLGRTLELEGVQTRPLWHPIHNLRMYQGEMKYRVENADQIYEQSIQLPSSVSLTDDGICRITELIKEVQSNGKKGQRR